MADPTKENKNEDRTASSEPLFDFSGTSSGTAKTTPVNPLGEKLEDKKKSFFNTLSSDDIKRRHDDSAQELRKSTREQNKAKKRGGYEPTAAFSPDNATINQKLAGVSLADLPQLMAYITSGNVEHIYFGTVGLRKLLSKKEDSPIQEIIDIGAVPHLIKFLELRDNPALQFEASWCLTNIATGNSEQTQCLTEKGAIPKFVSLLEAEQENLKDQAVWALGNIAGESNTFRDMVINYGIITPLLKLVLSKPKLAILRNACWALSNLVRGKPAPVFDKVKPIIPVIGKLIQETDDKEILTDSCWTLSYLTEGGEEKVKDLLHIDILRRLSDFLISPWLTVSVPALRTLGNIITGDDTQTQMTIEAGILPKLHQMLAAEKSAVRKEASWAISNITAGPVEQIQAVIAENIMEKIIELTQRDCIEVRRESVWALSNATSGANLEQAQYLIQKGSTEALCSVLTVKGEVRTIAIALEGLENLLKMGRNIPLPDGTNPVAASIEQCRGLEYLDSLQSHANIHIYKKVLAIIEGFFGFEEPEDSAKPADGSVSIFNF